MGPAPRPDRDLQRGVLAEPGAVRQGLGRPRGLREGHRRRAAGCGDVRRRDDRRGVAQGGDQDRKARRACRADPLAEELNGRLAPVVDVIVPARNEAATVAEVVRACRACRYARRVIVVDDGSTDQTGALAAAAGADLVLRRDSVEAGSKAHAMEAGVAASDADAFLFV
ncbi:MAG: hypothetical protein C4344_05225, partial [Acidimicrobiia bacterium]